MYLSNLVMKLSVLVVTLAIPAALPTAWIYPSYLLLSLCLISWDTDVVDDPKWVEQDIHLLLYFPLLVFLAVLSAVAILLVWPFVKKMTESGVLVEKAVLPIAYFLESNYTLRAPAKGITYFIFKYMV